MNYGTVKFFNDEKGFGFIAVEMAKISLSISQISKEQADAHWLLVKK